MAPIKRKADTAGKKLVASSKGNMNAVASVAAKKSKADSLLRDFSKRD